MRNITILFLLFFLELEHVSGQEINHMQQPDFILSRRTAALLVENQGEVQHIRYGRHPRSGTPTTYYIDFGCIGDRDYKYYLSCDRVTVYALPQDLPGMMYSIDICDYESQGGWASEEFIAQLRAEGGCASCFYGSN